jgi:hypothetical protein
MLNSLPADIRGRDSFEDSYLYAQSERTLLVLEKGDIYKIMAITFTRRAMSTFIVLSLTAVLIPIGAIAQGASAEHQINIEPLNKYAPVKVAAILYGKHTYPNPLGPHQVVRLEGGDTAWIANVSCAILNQSPKDITAIEAQIDIPDWQDASGAKKAIFFHVGKLPSNALIDSTGNQLAEESKITIDIKPGTQFALPLIDAFPKLRDYPLRTTSAEEVNSFWIRIRRVFFADGTMWVTNAYHKPDSSRPGVYNRITPQEFWAPK